MSTATCCATTLASAIAGAPAVPPMPRIRPGVVAAPRAAGPARIRLDPPAWTRAWARVLTTISAARGAWSAWRAVTRRRAELRALAALERHVLRDVGLAELVPPRQAPSWLDVERARW